MRSASQLGMQSSYLKQVVSVVLPVCVEMLLVVTDDVVSLSVVRVLLDVTEKEDVSLVEDSEVVLREVEVVWVSVSVDWLVVVSVSVVPVMLLVIVSVVQ